MPVPLNPIRPLWVAGGSGDDPPSIDQLLRLPCKCRSATSWRARSPFAVTHYNPTRWLRGVLDDLARPNPNHRTFLSDGEAVVGCNEA
jgi:hypothetical protein